MIILQIKLGNITIACPIGHTGRKERDMERDMERKFFTAKIVIAASSEESVKAMLERATCNESVLSSSIIAEDEERYARIAYDRAQDMFKLMLSTDGGDTWDFSTGSKCRRCKEDRPGDEPMFVHIDLIQAMKDAVLCGF